MGFFQDIGLKSVGRDMDGFFNKTFIHPWQKITTSGANTVSSIGGSTQVAAKGIGQGTADVAGGLGAAGKGLGAGLGSIGKYLPEIALGGAALMAVSVLKR